MYLGVVPTYSMHYYYVYLQHLSFVVANSSATGQGEQEQLREKTSRAIVLDAQIPE